MNTNPFRLLRRMQNIDMAYSLLGRRVLLRPLALKDFDKWSEVRVRNAEWLTKWEPQKPMGVPNPDSDRNAFALRCHTRDTEWNSGSSYGFGVFIDGEFAGEVNLNCVQRGPFQSAQVGYWIDEGHAGNSYIPESIVVLLQYAFEVQNLHRVEIVIVPRNKASIRVVEKLGLRNEGVSLQYLEINGVWEDHVRFAIVQDEWQSRRQELIESWLS